MKLILWIIVILIAAAFLYVLQFGGSIDDLLNI